MIYTNALNLPQAFVNAVKNDDYDAQGDVSITSLTNPPRPFWLKKRHNHEITVDVSKRVFSVFGRAVHGVMEKHADKNTITEERLKTKIGGWTVTGQPDLFTEDLIQDWKMTSVWVLIYDTNRHEYMWQLNAYRFLADANGFKNIKKLQNVFILRDWSMTKARNDPGYPQNTIEIVDQVVHPLEKVEVYLNSRVNLFRGHEDTPDDKLPECTPEERWHKDDTYALMKKGRKSSIKNCKTQLEAEDLLSQKFKGCDSIQFRPGQDMRCQNYCDCREHCSHYKNMLKSETPETEDE